MNKYSCPVCGYTGLLAPPVDHEICPCCGTHFGYHDWALSHEELTKIWIGNGARWFDHDTPPPAHWNALQQLFSAGLGYSFLATNDRPAIEYVGLDLPNETTTKVRARAA